MSKDIESIPSVPIEDTPGPSKPKRTLRRKIWLVTRSIIMGLVIMIFGALIALQLPPVQTWMAKKLSAFLKSEYGVDISIKRVNINFFEKSIYLNEVFVGDDHDNAIIQADIVKVNIRNIYTSTGYIDVQKVVLQGGTINISTYKGEEKPNLTQFIDKLKGQKKKKKKKGKKNWVINFETLILDECNLRVNNDNRESRDAMFLPNDIQVIGIGGKVDNFSVKGDTLEMDIENLQAIESSGLRLKKLSSHVKISSKELTFSGFVLQTPKSRLDGYFSMRYNNWKSFSHFIDSVEMIVDLNMSDINAADLSYFTNNLKGIDFDFRFKGGAVGTLSHLKAKGFSIYFGSISHMSGDIELDGLPDINKTYIKFNVRKLTTDGIDLRTVPIPPFYKKGYLKIPPEIDRLGVIKYHGDLEGYFSDMHIDGFANTKIGNADLNVQLTRPSKNADYHYVGKIDAQSFNIGTLINQKKLGTVTFTAKVEGHGFDIKNGKAHFKGDIDQLEFNGYNYHNITTDAFFSDKVFSGRVVMDDPNAALIFDGFIDLHDPKQLEYDFKTVINKADLNTLNFIKGSKKAILSTTATINLKGNSIDNIVGHGSFCSTDFEYGEQHYHMETLDFNSEIGEKDKIISLHSDFVNAKFRGEFAFIPLINEIKEQIYHVGPSLKIIPNDEIKYAPQDFYFYVIMVHPDVVTEIFMPDLKISEGTTIEGKLEEENNNVYIEINADKIQYKKMSISSWYFLARNKGEKMNIQSNADHFNLTDSLKFDNINMAATAVHDSLDLWVGFQNDKANLNGASINILTYFGNAPEYTFNFHDSYFYFNDSLWVLNEDNKIVMDKTSLTIENLNLGPIGSSNNLLSIHGKSSENSVDKLTVSFSDFPAAIANNLMGSDKLKFGGEIVGDVDFYQLLQKPYFSSDLTVQDFSLNESILGDLGLNVKFDPERSVLLINSDLSNNGTEIISLKNGRVWPYSKEEAFDIDADIASLNLSALEKLANPVFTDLSGIANGHFSLKGSMDDPRIGAKLNLQGASLRLDYLNAWFNFDMGNSFITLDNSQIKIPKMDLTDHYGNPGTLKGKVMHNMFKDIFLDIRLETNNMCVMETTHKDNERFYGTAFTTGKATIIGPMEDIVVAANMTTEKNTVLNIPLNSAKSLKENDFVVFITLDDTLDTYEEEKEDKGNFTIDLNVKATPEATVRIIFDETVGDVITAQGFSDNINLTFDTRGRFSMLGTYEITKGDYLFTLQNLINKHFSLKSGSSISFTGDPYLAQVNVTAVYRANASVYPILSSFMDPTTAELYRKATRIDCELLVTNTLADLLIGFNFQTPSLDATAANVVRSAINTQDEMNRQVFSLLVLNQFLPPESTGGGGSSTSMVSSSLGNTSLELLSGQLNNWLSKITKDVNIDLRYKSGDQSNNDQVSVALSTQLFNDRVIIDGDVGVGVGNQTQSSGNQIVGNVSVDVKVTKDGRLRVRAFNRSNDNNLTKNTAPYTQGMGISYKVEFDSWGDLFKRKKPRKKKEKKKKKEEINEPEKSDSLSSFIMKY